MAAVALLGGIFASSLRTISSMTNTRIESTNTLSAVEIVDRLLTEWTKSGGVPLNDEGEIDSTPGWIWRTSSVGDNLGVLQVNVVRVVVVADDGVTKLAECEVIVAESQEAGSPSSRDLQEDRLREGGVTP